MSASATEVVEKKLETRAATFLFSDLFTSSKVTNEQYTERPAESNNTLMQMEVAYPINLC